MTKVQKTVSHKCCPPSFMASPKFIKLAPLRPIVSSRDSITYGVAKELAYITKPLVGQSAQPLKTHNTLSNKSTTQGWNQVR